VPGAEISRQGSSCAGTDVSGGQIREAFRLARDESLKVRFITAPAERTPFRDGSFDVITANQCWLYFDRERILPDVVRLLDADGVLTTSHFSWLPRIDPIAQASEALVLSHNPRWSAADWHGEIPPIPSWAVGLFQLVTMFWYDEAVPFTRASWRGRLRACRGIGATLERDQVEAFDREHQVLLESLVPEEFTVLHRIDAHILRPVSPRR